jgi:CheY-like chemotaxis protein
MVSRYREDQPRGNPGVLVVDDDKVARDHLQTVLRHEGFEVWLAGGGAEALGLYSQLRNDNDIVAVLLDVRMPGMDGPQTLTALHRLNPEARCCFMTEKDDEEPELLERDVVTIFAKPLRFLAVTEVLSHLIHTNPCQDRAAVQV